METLDSYGVLHRQTVSDELDGHVESFERRGFTVLSLPDRDAFADQIEKWFELARGRYQEHFSQTELDRKGEANTIRMPFAWVPELLEVASRPPLLQLLGRLLPGQFFINQQNGVINPAGRPYSQSAWHRDLPYQHWVSSKPLAVNVLYCLDTFEAANGATMILPGSHRFAEFPSDSFVKENAFQISACRGDFIVINSMMYHRSGDNGSTKDRRAINTVFSIPFIRQQIDIPRTLAGMGLAHNPLIETHQSLLGFGFQQPLSIDEYIEGRPDVTSRQDGEE